MDSAVVRRQLRNVMSGSEPAATMHDVYVLFGVLLCNVKSKQGTSYNSDWFRNRVNDLVALFPGVSKPPPVPLYSESQAEALSALGKKWPHTVAQIVCTIVEGRFRGPMKRLQDYLRAQWRVAEIGAEPQPLEGATLEPPVPQEAVETPRPLNACWLAHLETTILNTTVVEEPRQEPGFNPVVLEYVRSIANATLQISDVDRPMPTAIASQKVLNSADKNGLVLQPVKLSSLDIRQQLNDLMADLDPAATMDDFNVLLGILLCNLSCRRGSDMNRGWYQSRANDLVRLFPDVSGEVSVRLYDEAQADAICAFAEQWPLTRAAIGSIILKGRFTGSMQRLQQYVSASWSFPGMEHAERTLECLVNRNPWVVDVIPGLKSKDLFS
ncbi:hypothetical protein MTO96_010250 [Rhipicephalus appendiculatus]